ncbi:MAG: FtsX-like permease family protein [Chloroflexota bacterium]
MLRTRWQKVLLDLWASKTRTLMVIFAVAVGVFAVGFMSSAYSILIRELRTDYDNLQSSSAIIFTDPFDQQLIKQIEKMPEVAVAEGRRSLTVRYQTPTGEWRDLNLTAIPDSTLEVDRLFPTSGSWPPGRQEFVVERLSLDFLGYSEGETLEVELTNGTKKSLTLSGTAFYNGVPNASVVNQAFGYISLDTLERLGQGAVFTEIRFKVAEKGDSLAHINGVTEEVRQQVERSGREVYATSTPPPGQHWAEDIIATMILLFLIFGGLILFLSSFLVINTVSALITQQVQQIGVMKLVGARRPQIITMYLIMVTLYCFVALLIAIPSSIWFGRWAATMSANLLNSTIDNRGVPFFVILLQIAVGLFIPLLAALWPIFGGVGITTQNALNSSGLDGGKFGEGLIDRLFSSIQNLLPVQRPFVISLRNTIRRKSRVALTLLILTMGTALFISVLTVRASISNTFVSFMRYHAFEVGLRTGRPYRTEQLQTLSNQFPQVLDSEGWLRFGTRRVRPDQSESGGYTLIGLPPDSQFVDPKTRAGRWLEPGERGSIVLNSYLLDEENDLSIGDEILLSIRGEEIPFTIVGEVHGLQNGEIYVSYADLATLTGNTGRSNSLQLKTTTQTAQSQIEFATILTEHFAAAGYDISSSTTEKGRESELEERFQIVFGFLLVMAGLLAVVGGLGLATTMSINILERIREIGVLRAIGASNSAVQRIVLTEGIMIGLASWVLGSIISVPLSRSLANTIGIALLQIPLDFTYSVVGLIGWLIAILFLAVVACLGPAQNAARLTIREVLAYE